MKIPPKTTQALWQDSYLSAGSEAYLDDLYEAYLKDPNQIEPHWRSIFDQMKQNQNEVSHQEVREALLKSARNNIRASVRGMETGADKEQAKVEEMIGAYRKLGHLYAKIDPLSLNHNADVPPLNLSFYGFSEKDLQKTFDVGSFTALNKNKATLQEIYEGLQRVYCGRIGFEFTYIDNSEELEWIKERIENQWANWTPTTDEKKRLLDRLVVADGLEKYLGFKYVGQKRFSLEGGDGLIPLLDTIVNQSAKHKTQEIIIGMAHRGRLNVLVNVLGKSPTAIFAAFEGKGISTTHSGDVKYHLGYSSHVVTPYGPIYIALAFNPSHLEIVAPVVQGSVRARQRRRADTDKNQVIAIQIHGDAAFAGQGVVMETFSMSQARWFTVGGSIHIVINNQVGFTTSNPKDARSSTYCTDVAKMVEPPILHVNGNDAEAVYFAALFAIDYRTFFKRDVVIDLVCYRRHGHNEADEPSATQPLMYKVIKSMPVPYMLYAQKLVEEGVIKEDSVKKLTNNYRTALDNGQDVTKTVPNPSFEFNVDWAPFVDQPWTKQVKTSVPLDQIKAIAKRLETLPDGFVLQPQVKKTFEAQIRMSNEEAPINWGYAEIMAYATLLMDGYPIRLCGQDAARGTFAHRHAVLHDQNTGKVYIPLSHIALGQAQINIVDSLLSENAVLAFEYGYAASEPNYLDIWEAQYGDFANGAQVVIDQFISSGEQKWGRLCGLVMLLPHGYEGSGPEHSSARLERYLQLCAQDNLQVCVPTLPAQIFHLLRRQMLRPYRKPLIIMSPKSTLRSPLAVSSLKDLSDGEFQLVIPEIDEIDPKQVERVVWCYGKVYYDLLEKRRELKLNHVAIMRIEQLYPFPVEAFKAAMEPYQSAKDIIWCQEEPENQGGWGTLNPEILNCLKKQQQLRFVGRKPSASPAVGYHSVHVKEQQELVTLALT